MTNYDRPALFSRLMICTHCAVRAHRRTVADATNREIDPVTFDSVNVDQGSLFNRASNTVTIRRSGYYYLYISAGAAQRQVSSCEPRAGS